MKNWRKYTFWAIFDDMYRYTLNMYRYSLGSGHFGPTCTDTGQRCTSTCNALFFYFDQFLYFSHNLLIYYPFELFKWIIKIDFKENQTYRNRSCQILTLGGPKIHSKWGHVQAKFCFSFDHRVVQVVSDVS